MALLTSHFANKSDRLVPCTRIIKHAKTGEHHHNHKYYGRADLGFHGPITVMDVAEAVNTIADQLKGDGHTIYIMSGTHGYCDGQVGAVASREQRFADEDRGLASPTTSDGKPVTVTVRAFHNYKLPALKSMEFVKDKEAYVTAAMPKLRTCGT